MKNKFIIIALVIAMLFGAINGVVAEDTASITINTHVQESTVNSGIRITTETDAVTGQAFDTLFYSSVSDITLAENEDVSVAEQTGKFSIMVRRVATTPLTVTATGSKMKLVGGTDSQTIDYFIKTSTEGHNWTKMSVNALDYNIGTPSSGIIRDFTSIDYKIPVTAEASAGSYTATIIFTVTTV